MFGNNVLDRFEDGLNHAERLRRILPPLYNSARLKEQPIPSINAMINIQEEEEENGEDLSCHSEPIETNGNEDENGLELVQNNASNEDIDEQVQIEHASETDDVKIEHFQQVVMEPEDLNAVDNLFADNGQDIEQLNSTLDGPSVSENSEEDTSSSSIECIFESLDDFRPKVLENGYFIKPNDILSNNIPFKTNVSFFLNVHKSVCFEKCMFQSRQMVTAHSACKLDANSKRCCCLLVL